MKPFRDISISRKLTLALLASGIVPLLIAVALVLGYELTVQRSRIVDQLIAQAEMIAVSTRATLEFEDHKRATETLATLAARPEILAACLYTLDGEVFASYIRGDESGFKFPALAEPGHRILGDNLDLFHPIGAGLDGVGHVFLRADMRVLRARFPQYVRIVVAVLIGLVALSFWIARMFERSISRPILALARTAQVVQDSKDFSVRAEKHGEDEIGHLTQAFNQMVSGIEEATLHLRRANESLQAEVIERQRAEDEIKRRSLELEAANQELEAFSYSVSHDLRSPLRAVGGYARILTADHAGQLDADGRQVLATICSEGKRMGVLIDDLLEFSRMGRQAMRSTPIDVTKLAQTVFNELQARSPQRNVRLELAEMPEAFGDYAMLRQVFINLLANAIKFSSSRAEAVIEVGESDEKSATDHASRLTDHASPIYFIRDNGVGFDMRHADKLFGVFQRLHSEEEFEGTGVGLALVQRIIHRHCGKVWAEGKPGAGATFYFTLPARKAGSDE